MLIATSHLVRFGECDPSGIVFNPNYLRWFDDNFHSLLMSRDISFEFLTDQHQLDGLPIVETNIKFLRPIRFGMCVVITSTVNEIRNSSLYVTHEVNHEGQKLCQANEVRVWIAKGTDGSLPKATRIPDAIRARLAPLPD